MFLNVGSQVISGYSDTLVADNSSKQIKINVGSALPTLENPPEPFIVTGPNRMTSLPMEVPVTHEEISHCIEKSIMKMEAAILAALEQTPPELYADIVKNGIYLAGGGALLRGLAFCNCALLAWRLSLIDLRWKYPVTCDAPLYRPPDMTLAEVRYTDCWYLFPSTSSITLIST